MHILLIKKWYKMCSTHQSNFEFEMPFSILNFEIKHVLWIYYFIFYLFWICFVFQDDTVLTSIFFENNHQSEQFLHFNCGAMMSFTLLIFHIQLVSLFQLLLSQILVKTCWHFGLLPMCDVTMLLYLVQVRIWNAACAFSGITEVKLFLLKLLNSNITQKGCLILRVTNGAIKYFLHSLVSCFFYYLVMTQQPVRVCQFGTTKYLNVPESNNGFMLLALSCNSSPSYQPSLPLNKQKTNILIQNLLYTNDDLDLHRDAFVQIESLKKHQMFCFSMQIYFCVFYSTDRTARCILCSAEAADITPGAHVWYQLVCYTEDKQWAVNARFFFSLRTITQHTSLDWKRNADRMLWPDVCVFVPFGGLLPWFIQSNWACVEKHVLVCVCCVGVYVALCI